MKYSGRSCKTQTSEKGYLEVQGLFPIHKEGINDRSNMRKDPYQLKCKDDAYHSKNLFMVCIM